MPGSSSWMPYAPQGVKGLDDYDDGDDDPNMFRNDNGIFGCTYQA